MHGFGAIAVEPDVASKSVELHSEVLAAKSREKPRDEETVPKLWDEDDDRIVAVSLPSVISMRCQIQKIQSDPVFLLFHFLRLT